VRLLLSVFCLLLGSASASLIEALEAEQSERVEQYRAFIAEIASGVSASITPPHDLPAIVREVIETRIKP
jgi:hypothetical protein